MACSSQASPDILAGKETPLTRAIAFLYREYDPTCFWWELMEMLRKFLLVGLFVIIQPGSILQIVIGTITCAIFLMVQLQAQQEQLLKQEIRDLDVRQQQTAAPPLNMEYLRSIVLGYIEDTGDRARLLPVLAELLQFGEAEVQR